MAQDQIREKVEKLVRGIAGAAQVRSMYSEDHDLTKKAVNKLYYILEDILFIKNEITVGIIGSEFAFEKEPFYDASRQIQGFIQHLKAIKADKISFLKGVTREELTNFMSILAMNAETLKKTGGLERFFELSEIKNIALGKIGYKKEEIEEVSEDLVGLAKQNFQNGVEILESVAKNIFENKAIDVKGVRSFVNNIVSSLLSNRSSLLMLTAVKSHDEYSFVHNINVAIFSLLIGETLGLEQNYLNEIGVAALLHDVGKLSIPSEILRKRAALSEGEFKIIQAHPVYGAKILLESPDVCPLASIVAFEHHIKYDTSGYPERIFKDKELNLATMIVTISDFYDAMRSKRAYSGEIAPEKTYQEMIELGGTHFHEGLLNHFFNIIGVYPPGTLVELDTREIGLVLKGSLLDIKRPQVEILYDGKGNIVKKSYVASLIDKDTKTGKYKHSIVRSIVPSEKFDVPEKYKE